MTHNQTRWEIEGGWWTTTDPIANVGQQQKRLTNSAMWKKGKTQIDRLPIEMCFYCWLHTQHITSSWSQMDSQKFYALIEMYMNDAPTPLLMQTWSFYKIAKHIIFVENQLKTIERRVNLNFENLPSCESYK